MPNILDIRRRIRSVINTRQITKAMKMVSAAKLRRAQERALAARPYAQMLTNVLKSLVARTEIYDPETGEPKHPLLAQREEKNILLIVVTGDKGLAGAFNANITKAAARFLESKAGKNVDIEAIGRKGRDFLRRRYPAAKVQTQSLAELAESIETEPEEARARRSDADYGRTCRRSRQSGIRAGVGAGGKRDRALQREEIDAVYIVFNEFKSVIAQRLIVEQILPIEQIGAADRAPGRGDDGRRKEEGQRSGDQRGRGHARSGSSRRKKPRRKFGTAQVDYIYEQPPEELFRALLPKYVSIQIFRALLESVAAEHAARMTAMDSATNNATDMIDSLTLVMNRARQAKITKEIIEIVSGAAAM